jgi:hypothetical protein
MCLHRYLSQRATHLNQHLENICHLLEHDKELARRLIFKVQPKNYGDKNRLLKFKQYSGPDKDTLELLANYAYGWTYQPLQFWDPSLAMGYDVSVDPQVNIFCAFLQSKHDHA